MGRSEQLEQFHQRLARLEDLYHELESLGGIRSYLAERVNCLLSQLENCQSERDRLMMELEEAAEMECDADDGPAESRRGSGSKGKNNNQRTTQILADSLNFERELGSLHTAMTAIGFEVSSLEEAVSEVELELDSLNQPYLRTNPQRGH